MTLLDVAFEVAYKVTAVVVMVGFSSLIVGLVWMMVKVIRAS